MRKRERLRLCLDGKDGKLLRDITKAPRTVVPVHRRETRDVGLGVSAARRVTNMSSRDGRVARDSVFAPPVAPPFKGKQ